MPAMTNKPLSPYLPTLTLRPKQAAAHALQPRATLEGLEVRESSFGQWLEAGGDRRTQPREDGVPRGER